MKKVMTISLVAAGMFMAACCMCNTAGAKTVSQAAVDAYKLRMQGKVDDANSLLEQAVLKNPHDAAKAAGDTQKVKELEEWGQSSQTKAHLQGFGTAPVKNLLETVKDKLPQVAQQAGVDIIVSKWQIDYQAKEAQFVDVTDAIVALYKPSEETRKMLEEMKKQQPVAEEELLKMKD